MSLSIRLRLAAACKQYDYAGKNVRVAFVDKKQDKPTCQYCVDPVEYAISQLKRSHK